MSENSILDRIIQDIKVMEEKRASYSDLKDMAIRKMSMAVEKMELDPDNEKPSSIEAKTRLIDTMVNTIDSITATDDRIIKLKQKMLAMDDKDSAEELAAKVISKFLMNTNLNDGPKKSDKPIEDDLDVDESEFEISEGELEIGQATDHRAE